MHKARSGRLPLMAALVLLCSRGLRSTFCAAGPLPRAVKPADMPRAPMLGLVPSSKGLLWRLRRREDPGASCTSMATLPLLLSFLAAGTASAQWYAETETGKALAKVRSNISTAALKLRADTVQANRFVGLGAGAYIFGEPTWENTHDFWQTLGSSAQGAAIGDILGYAFGCLVGSGVAANAKQEALRALNAKKPPAKLKAELNHIKENAALKATRDCVIVDAHVAVWGVVSTAGAKGPSAVTVGGIFVILLVALLMTQPHQKS